MSSREGGDLVIASVSDVGEDGQYFVYLLASKIGGTRYIGVTTDLVRRVHEHREKLADGFTKKYNVAKLVYFEAHSDNWDDLYSQIAKV